jgi:hypothetical protein
MQDCGAANDDMETQRHGRLRPGHLGEPDYSGRGDGSGMVPADSVAQASGDRVSDARSTGVGDRDGIRGDCGGGTVGNGAAVCETLDSLEHDIEFLRGCQKRLGHIIECIEQLGTFREMLKQANEADARMAMAAAQIREEGAFNLAGLEKRTILAAAQTFGGNGIKVAAALGIGKTTAYRKMKQYGISLGNGKCREAAKEGA